MSEALLQLPESQECIRVDVEAQEPIPRPPPELGPCQRAIANVLARIVQIILIIMAMTCLFISLIVCCPCLCYCCFLRIREGRVVTLDGTEPPEPDEDTQRNIEEAQAATFTAQFVNSFASPRRQLGQMVSSMTSTRSINDSQRLIEERPDGGVEALRDQLREDRLRRYELHRKERRDPTLPGYLRISIGSREEIVQQSLQCVGNAQYFNLLAKHLTVSFSNEQGVDAGGVARDWFDSLGRSLATAAEKGDGHLMVLPDNTLFPRPYETRFTELYAIGRLIGLAVWFEISVPISLGSVACKFLLDEPISPADVRRLDPDFYKFRVEPVLRPGGVAQLEEALCEPLMFVSAATDLRESKELTDGGASTRVTEENKNDYIYQLCNYHLCGDMQEQINVFLKGFWDIFPKEQLKDSSLSYRDLALLIAGYSDLDPHDWQLHTEVTCKDGCELLVSWFWEMVAEMSQEERAKLLHFTTGSSRLPASGFAGMSPPFSIYVQNQDEQHLPQSHTCGNQLVLPPYRSKERLVMQMKVALQNDEGFGFM